MVEEGKRERGGGVSIGCLEKLWKRKKENLERSERGEKEIFKKVR